jgi:Flp pilus assembly protein TadB
MGFTDDLRAVPDDVRNAMRETEGKLERTAEERPVMAYALDLRIVLVSVLGAFVVALILRLLGLPFMLSFLVFLLVLGGLWMVLANAAAPRRPTARSRATEGAQLGAGAPRERDEAAAR